VSKFPSPRRRTTVEEKDMQLEPDEDVEGHVNAGVNAEAEAVNARQDEGDDVEGHVQYGVNAAPEAVNAAHDDEDDDDVEGHVNY
jgi:hypothetical protein